MASPVSDDIACFDSLPDDLVGVIMSKLDLINALRLTQASPTARRLVQGERAVPGVFGKVSVHLPRDVSHDFGKGRLEFVLTKQGFKLRRVKANTESEAQAARDEEEDAERQPIACLVHLLEWIRVRARAFTEIEIDFESSSGLAVLDHVASTFLPNVPSSFRGKISFKVQYSQKEWEHVPTFLAAWRALAPAYECGLTFTGSKVPSDLVLASFQAAPPLSSIIIYILQNVDGLYSSKFFDSLDTSRLTELDIFCWMLESLPSPDVLPPTLQDLSLRFPARCWSSLDALLAPLHRLTDLKLRIESTAENLDLSLTLAPFTVLPNLRLLTLIASWPGSLVPPLVGSAYWKEPIVLPALEVLSLMHSHNDFPDAPGEEGGLAAGQPPRWPTLLSNLEAPKLERLDYEHLATGTGHYRTLDLPLGHFPRLQLFEILLGSGASLDLPALREEIATLPHFQKSAAVPNELSSVHFYANNPVPEEEVETWERDLGFDVYCVHDFAAGRETLLVEVFSRFEVRM